MANKQHKEIDRCIAIVRRFRVSENDWEIRHWEVRQRLIKSMQRLKREVNHGK